MPTGSPQSTPHEFRRALEEAGPALVRNALARGAYAQHGREAIARQWLALRDAEASLELEARRDAREGETIELVRSADALAREANEAAQEANRISQQALFRSARQERWAMYAAIVATIALIISVKDAVIDLVLWWQ